MVTKAPAYRNNILNLQSATCEEDSYKHVVANFKGTRLYYSKAGWGRLYAFIYKVIAIFSRTQFAEKKKLLAFSYTVKEFNDEQVKIDKTLQRIEKSFKDIIEGYNLNREAFFDDQVLFTGWYDDLGKFISSVSKETNTKVQTLIKTYLAFKDPKQAQKETPFNLKESLKKIKRYRHIIELERSIDKKTPYTVFTKLSMQKPLKGKNKKSKLSKWISKVNEKKELTVRKFHKGLKALVEHIAEFHRPPAAKVPTVAHLEVELLRKKCTVLQKEDVKHKKWKNELKAGDRLSTPQGTYTLKEQLGDPNKPDDNNKVFTIKESPDKVIVICKNQALPAMKEIVAKDFSWGVRPAEWLYVDPEGRFSVVERLERPLNVTKWSSKGKLSGEDRLRASPFIGQIKWLLEQENTPENFFVKYLMFDRKGVLKCTKPTTIGEFNIVPIIQFAWECSGGNLVVFKHIMEESKVEKHPYMLYLKEIVDNALKDDDLTPENLAAFQRHLITDPKTIDEAKKIQHDIKEIKRKCTKKILKGYVVEDVLGLNDAITNRMKIIYGECGMVGLSADEVKKRAFEHIKKGYSAKKSSQKK
jgi:hypothetical protein